MFFVFVIAFLSVSADSSIFYQSLSGGVKRPSTEKAGEHSVFTPQHPALTHSSLGASADAESVTPVVPRLLLLLQPPPTVQLIKSFRCDGGEARSSSLVQPRT